MSIFYSKEKDGTLNVLVCGKLTRDPELKENAKGNKIRFSVAYGKSKYIDCDVWADSHAGQIAGCLEKGDIIGAAGTHRTWEYNDKTYSILTVDAIFPMAAPLAPAVSETQDVSDVSTTTYQELSEDDDEGELPF